MPDRPFQLQSITIGDAPETWSAAGFVLDGRRVTIANTVIELAGTAGGRGILYATVDGLGREVDGLPFTGATPPPLKPVPHPNLVAGFDHLVAMSPDMDRTTTALIDEGFDHRRTRRFDAGGSARRQEFFWLGDVILELVGEDNAHGSGPAVFWGVALTCDDLDHAAETLGVALGAVKPALQSGRWIATLRTRELDISVPIALMSPHRGPEQA